MTEEDLYIQDSARAMIRQHGRDGAVKHITRILAQGKTSAPPEFWIKVLHQLNKGNRE